MIEFFPPKKGGICAGAGLVFGEKCGYKKAAQSAMIRRLWFFAGPLYTTVFD